MEKTKGSKGKRLLVIMPDEWHASLKEKAKYQSKSMGTLIREAIFERYITKKQPKD